jgi:hypothetical protein
MILAVASGMTRAALVALGLTLVLLWLVAVVNGSTIWLTWLAGIAAVLTFWLVPITRDDSGPLEVAIGPALIGTVLTIGFIVGMVTNASGWLTWFVLVFAGGYFLFAGFAFLVRAFEPRYQSRRPISRM